MQEKLKLSKNCHGAIWRFDRSNWTPYAHSHPEIEINLVTAGRAVYLFEGQRHELSRYAVGFLFAGKEHLLLESTPDFAMWILVIRRQWLKTLIGDQEDYLALVRKTQVMDLSRRLEHDAFSELEQIAASLHGQEDDPARLNAGLGYLVLCLWRAFRQSAQSASQDLHPSVEKALSWLKDNPETGLPDLARIAGLSPSRLSRLFKAQVGMPLAQFRNRVRLNHFMRIYGDGRQVTLLTAALEAGFQSYTPFFRAFQKHYHASPRDLLG